MKKQQWLFKQVFSMINSSSSSTTTTTSFNNIVRPRRPFCSTTTNKSLFAAAAAPTVVAPPALSNNKQQEQEQEQQLNILLEKKLPLLMVPYDHVTQPKDIQRPSRHLDGGGFVCDGTLGFISPFHEKEDDDQLIINKNKKEEVKVIEVNLPEIAKRRICGSSGGWLVTVHQNGELQLLNPVTRAIVHLPPLTAFPEVTAEFVSDGEDDTTRRLSYRISSRPETLTCSHEFREKFIKKVVTNTTATNSTTLPATANTVVVMAIYDDWRSLAFCRTPSSSSSSTGNGIDDSTTTDEHAAKRWIMIPTVGDDNDRDGWIDITFYKGDFYAVGPYGYVGVVKGLDGPSPFVQIIIHEPEDEPGCFLSINYLVESSSSSGGTGDLLMVMRDQTYDNEECDKDKEEDTEEEEEKEEDEIFEHPYRTIGFKVLKLNLNNGPPSWEEVTDLGEDCALFVGYNHSFSFSASKVLGCRGNCIYFTDNHPEKIFINPTGGHDIGVYNLGDNSFEKLKYETSSFQLFMPPPVWYVPTDPSGHAMPCHDVIKFKL